MYFDANGARVELQLDVVWNDGTRSTQVTTFHSDGGSATEGELEYPDDTQASIRFRDDGTWEIDHRQLGSDDITTWRYNADGSALVKEVRPCHDLESHGGVMKTWNVRPDGSLLGTFDMWEDLVQHAQGRHHNIHTRRYPDGTWAVTIQEADDSGHVLHEKQTTHQPPGPAAAPPPTSAAPIVPTAATTADASRFGIFGTSRLPEPSLAMGAGWEGSAPPPVAHITDRWHEYPPGIVTYLGSDVSLDE
ncbi:hypothetical protein [Agromyces sp. NPDC057865]|uniref:hypothetical protein n=1 Tax=Agromyces sp. NPDC057865 TaxID=3346267 RepID=UPI00366AEC15